MFCRNAIPYRIKKFSFLQDQFEVALAKKEFTPCGGLEAQRSGFVKVRDGFTHKVGEFIMIQLCTETKVLPAKAVRKLADEKCAEIEKSEGVKPGRKRRKEIQEQLYDQLLPTALVEQRMTRAWLAPEQGWLVVDATSSAVAERIIKAIVDAVEDSNRFDLSMVDTAVSPSAAMTGWLAGGEGPAGFSIDRDCELRLPGEERSTVRYLHHPLDGPEIGEHIAAGKQAVSMAMTWTDRVSFVLTEQMKLKRIQFLDVVKEQLDKAEDADAYFDAEFAMVSGELSNLMADLVQAMGGYRA